MTAPVQRAHLTWFQGKLLAASWDRTRLYAIGPASVEAYRLPAGCTIGVSYEPGTGYMDYNMLAAAQSYLYAILEDAAYWPPAVGIARSSDLRHFQWMTRDRRRLVSMEHWEDMDVIIAGGQGRDAALWKLDTYPFLEYLPALGR